jgi:hypothetical protein
VETEGGNGTLEKKGETKKKKEKEKEGEFQKPA